MLEKKELENLINIYKSAKEISNIIGVHPKTIERWCKKYKLKTRGYENNIKDISNKKFRRLTPLFIVKTSKDRHKIWHCVCDCGNEIDVSVNSLTSGLTQSCGCLHIEATKKSNTKYEDLNKRLYKIWSSMKERCNNNSNERYPHYGARGIKVCDKWMDDFKSFEDWAMKNGYTNDLTIDRINNNGNYEPNNCRWATYNEQNNNKRNNITFTHNNKTQTLKQWSDELNINYSTVKSRLNYGWTIQKSLGLE